VERRQRSLIRAERISVRALLTFIGVLVGLVLLSAPFGKVGSVELGVFAVVALAAALVVSRRTRPA
jgi:Na+/H+ antiporter NhaD/arsenite permease-like protein